jgi:hypothetical protein
MRAETGTKTVDTTELLNALVAFKNGDFSVRLPTDRTGVGGKVYDALNEIFGQNEQMARKSSRASAMPSAKKARLHSAREGSRREVMPLAWSQ